ncbi:MAG: hypothetical protein AAF989_10725 [Planctomycetota bacterium]
MTRFPDQQTVNRWLRSHLPRQQTGIVIAENDDWLLSVRSLLGRQVPEWNEAKRSVWTFRRIDPSIHPDVASLLRAICLPAPSSETTKSTTATKAESADASVVKTGFAAPVSWTAPFPVDSRPPELLVWSIQPWQPPDLVSLIGSLASCQPAPIQFVVGRDLKTSDRLLLRQAGATATLKHPEDLWAQRRWLRDWRTSRQA